MYVVDVVVALLILYCTLIVALYCLMDLKDKKKAKTRQKNESEV